MSLSGYNDPIGERNSLTARSLTLRRENNPYLLLKSYRTPPRVSLYISGEAQDGYEAGAALQSIAKPPTIVQVVLLPRSAGWPQRGPVAAAGPGDLPLADPADRARCPG